MKKISLVCGFLFTIVFAHASVFAEATPRIALWYGKVNQHVDLATGAWQSDPDGFSGADLDKLTYCKKWYPNTVRVEEAQTETISTWKRSMYYEQSNYAATVPTYACVQGTPTEQPSITVLSPNGGEVYQAGKQITVMWNSSNILSTENVQVLLEAPFPGGGVFDLSPYIVGGGSVLNTGHATFTLPVQGLGNGLWYQMQYGNYYRIKIQQTTAPNNNPVFASDYSNSTFIIQAPATSTTTDLTPRIAYWPGKVNQHVDTQGVWTSDPDGISGADLDKVGYCRKWYSSTTTVEPYKTETITTWKRARGYEQSSYTNTVLSYTCVSGTSSSESITVLSPNGGEVYETDQSLTVTWTSTGIPANTLLEVNIFSDNPSVFGFLAPTGTPNDGSETFSIKSLPPGSHYTITVGIPRSGFNNSDLRISDKSNAPFTINLATNNGACTTTSTPWVSVVSPNGGQVYLVGDQIPVEWSACGQVGGSFKITLENAETRNTYLDGETSLNQTSRTITIPNTITLGQYKVRLFCGVFNSDAYCTGSPVTSEDRSDNFFTINAGSTSLPAGCTSTAGYSPTTGLRCSVTVKTIVPITPVKVVPFTRELKFGATGTDVTSLQTRLKTEGVYTGPVTGYFGALTQAAVKKFQTKYQIPAVGVIGPRTLETLNTQ